MAEKAAWDFWSTLDRKSCKIEEKRGKDPKKVTIGVLDSNRFALTVLNPTFIIGPVLSDCENGSATVSLNRSLSLNRTSKKKGKNGRGIASFFRLLEE